MKKSLKTKIEELDEMVEWFNSEDFELEKAVDNYKKALKMAEEIERDLKNLKNEVEVLDVDFSEDIA